MSKQSGVFFRRKAMIGLFVHLFSTTVVSGGGSIAHKANPVVLPDSRDATNFHAACIACLRIVHSRVCRADCCIQHHRLSGLSAIPFLLWPSPDVWCLKPTPSVGTTVVSVSISDISSSHTIPCSVTRTRLSARHGSVPLKQFHDGVMRRLGVPEYLVYYLCRLLHSMISHLIEHALLVYYLCRLLHRMMSHIEYALSSQRGASGGSLQSQMLDVGSLEL